MLLKNNLCYICKIDKSVPWANENGYSMVKCTKCDLVYLNPSPALSEITEAKRTGLHETKEGTLNTIGRYSSKKVKDFELKIAQLGIENEFRNKPCRWLDIGAGYGEFIKALLKVCPEKSEIVGIELSEAKVKKAKAMGLLVEQSSISDIRRKFTHISLINVYSHLPNPIEFLCELKRIMEPKGQLILVTGNGGDLSRSEIPGNLYLPDHLSFAGEENIKMVLLEAGFKVIGVRRFKIESMDNIVIAFSKNILRRVLGRAPVPLRIPENSKFRSVWYHAENNI